MKYGFIMLRKLRWILKFIKEDIPGCVSQIFVFSKIFFSGKGIIS